jgi:hypothetical protein
MRRIQAALDGRTCSGLETRDTADWKSALQEDRQSAAHASTIATKFATKFAAKFATKFATKFMAKFAANFKG